MPRIRHPCRRRDRPAVPIAPPAAAGTTRRLAEVRARERRMEDVERQYAHFVAQPRPGWAAPRLGPPSPRTRRRGPIQGPLAARRGRRPSEAATRDCRAIRDRERTWPWCSERTSLGSRVRGNDDRHIGGVDDPTEGARTSPTGPPPSRSGNTRRPGPWIGGKPTKKGPTRPFSFTALCGAQEGTRTPTTFAATTSR